MAIAPLAMDTYLPAFPMMADSFGVGIAAVQYTLVSFMLGSTLGHFLGGPISDVVGTFKVALSGCVLFSITSLIITQTDQIDALMPARILQGFAAGAAGVVVNAVITSHYPPKQSARIISTVTLVILGVPLVSPLIGIFLIKSGGWHAIFYFLAAYGVLAGVLVWFNCPRQGLRELGLEKTTLILRSKSLINGYRTILAKPIGRLYLVAIGLNIAVYWVFATSAAFAYMSFLGASLELFPFLMGVNTIFLVIGNRLGVFLLRRHEPYTVCMIGSAAQAALCVILLLTVTFLDPGLNTVVLLIALTVGTIPISGPNASSVFMHLHDRHAGTASACLGIARVMFGMIGGFIVTITYNGSLLPMAILMSVISIFSMITFHRAGRYMQRVGGNQNLWLKRTNT